MTGFVTVEIDEGSFKAIGQRGGFLSSSKVERNGSFQLLRADEDEQGEEQDKKTRRKGRKLGGQQSPPSAEGSSGEDGTLVGELEFHADEHSLDSVAGVGLPKPLSPSTVRDLGRKKRKVSIKVLTLDKIMLLFPERKFYLMERASPTLDPGAATTPINVLLVTNIVTLIVSGIADALGHET